MPRPKLTGSGEILGPPSSRAMLFGPDLDANFYLMTLRSWFLTHYEFFHDFASPIATLVAAIAAAGITFYFNRSQRRIAQDQANTAKQQARLAAVRLRHDLYDRQFAIFQNTREFLSYIMLHGQIEDAALIQRFALGTADAVFLLDDDLTAYLETIRVRAIELRRLGIVMSQHTHTSSPDHPADEEANLLNWFNEQFVVLVEKFKPLLTLRTK
jgi:hypothetical protein